MAYRLSYSDYVPPAAPPAPPVAPPTPEDIPGGPSFIGNPQPPDVPCDPVGDGWRGPQGPQGPPGQSTAFYGASPPGDVLAPLWWDTVSGQLYIQYNDGSSTQWVVANSTIANGGPFLPITGGTVTGPLTLASTLKMGSITAPGYLEYTTTGTARLHYMVGTTERFSIADAAAANFNSVGGNALTVTGGQFYLPGNTTPSSYTFLMGPYTDTATQPGNFASMNKTFNATGGSVTVPANLVVNTTVRGAPNYYVWSINQVMNLNTTGVSSGQHVGIASTINRNSGATPGFVFFGQMQDKTGLPPGVASQSIGFELDLTQSGAESTTDTTFAPSTGARCSLHIVNAGANLPTWAATHAYTAGDVINSGPANAYTYIAQTTGTSAGTPPTWPTSAGTVTDGGVTWAFGTTMASQVSRAIDIGTARAATYGAGILLSGVYYDACIEMSSATLDTATNPNAAAIRLPANLPIDLSGDYTAAGQNQHTLVYRSATQRLYYTVAGVDMWSIDASGNVRARGTVTGSTTP
jgi:hypothetical protein